MANGDNNRPNYPIGGQGDMFALGSNPLSWLLALAPYHPDLAAHLLGAAGPPPSGRGGKAPKLAADKTQREDPTQPGQAPTGRGGIAPKFSGAAEDAATAASIAAPQQTQVVPPPTVPTLRPQEDAGAAGATISNPMAGRGGRWGGNPDIPPPAATPQPYEGPAPWGRTPRYTLDPADPRQYISPPPPAADPSAVKPSSTGLSGADGAAQQQTQPPPVATSPVGGTRPESPGPSPRDKGGWAGTDTGPIGTSVPYPDSPTVDAADTSGDSQTGGRGSIKDVAGDLSKIFGALKAPEDKWTPMPQPQLPGHMNRFTPADLLQMVSTLSAPPAQRSQPASLGALIGGR